MSGPDGMIPAILEGNVVISVESRGQSTSIRYRGDLTAGGLKVQESRVIADLLVRDTDPTEWHRLLIDRNVLQARTPATAERLGRLIRGRLELMDRDLWLMIRDGTGTVVTHAVLAAAIKHSHLLGDFLDLVVREQYRAFSPALSLSLWDDYLTDCGGRDPEMPVWSESTRERLRSSVFQTLAEAGYIENTRTRKLHPVHIAPQVLRYLQNRNERYVLRCIEVSP